MGKIEKKIVQSSKAPKAIGPYSQAVMSGGFLFTSGQIPLDPTTMKLVPGGIKEQTRQVLENLKSVLEAGDLSFSHVVKTTIYLQDLGDFSQVNEIYSEYFTGEPPARSTVQVARLPLDSRVEIEVVAKI